MADLVGEAYVRVHADTKFMARAIRRDLSKVGKEGADSLLENFDETLRNAADRKLKGAQRELADAIVGGDFDRLLKKHGGSVEEFVDDIGKDLDRLAKNGKIKFKDFETAAESLDQWAEKSIIARTAREQADAFEASWREAEKLNRRLKEQERLGQEMADAIEKADLAQWRRQIQQAADALKAYDKQMDEAHERALRMNRDIDNQAKAEERLREQVNKAHAAALRMDAEREASAQRLRDNMVRVHAQAMRMNAEWDKTHRVSGNVFTRLELGMRNFNRDMTRVDPGGLVGRLFGKGSRNDFLNFIGSAIGGITSLGTAIFTIPGKVLEGVFKTVSDGVEKMKELRAAGVSVVAILGRGMAAGAAVAIPAIGALVAGALVLSHVLPAIVSLVSALAGGLVAVAAAASFSLAGWLLPAVPAAVALAAGLGSVIGLFKGMGDMDKKGAMKLYPGLKQLKKAMDELRESTEKNRDEFQRSFGETFAPLLTKTVLPVMQEIQKRTIGLVDHFGELFNGKQMAPFLKIWEQRIPIIFDNLGRGINNLLAGFVKFFAPIVPYAQQLSKNFETMFENFNKWAGSAKGQTAIKSFMNDAWQAGESLWQTIKNIGVALANTFDVGQENAGGSFLGWLEDLTGRWRTWTDSVEGQKSLKDWFTEAKDVGSDLVTILGDVLEFFKRLNTEQGKQDLKDALDAIKSFSKDAGTIADAITGVSGALDSLADAIERIKYPKGKPAGSDKSFTETLSEEIANWKQFGEDVNGVLDSIAGSIGGFSTWAMSGFGLADIDWGGLWTSITQPLSDFGTQVNEHLTSIAQGFTDFSNFAMSGFGLQGVLEGVGEMIVAPFRWAWDQLFGHSYIPDIVNGFQRLIPSIPGIITGALAGVGELLVSPFRAGAGALLGLLGQVPGQVGGALGRVPGVVSGALSAVIDRLPSPFREGASRVRSALSGLVGSVASFNFAGAASRAVSGVLGALKSPFERAKAVIDGIMASIERLIARIPGLQRTAASAKAGIDRIVSSAGAALSNLNPFDNDPRKAAGGILTTATRVVAGEAGREAIIPLDRPLSLIDPSVRGMAAILRGQSVTSAGLRPAITFQAGAIVVQSPHADPALVAEAVVDRLASMGF